jgi:hypothetical protein
VSGPDAGGSRVERVFKAPLRSSPTWPQVAATVSTLDTERHAGAAAALLVPRETGSDAGPSVRRPCHARGAAALAGRRAAPTMRMPVRRSTAFAGMQGRGSRLRKRFGDDHDGTSPFEPRASGR